ncbi:MAG: HD domain-containing protein [Solirubrobacterales bacterium]|nr:HD domain-containing protein [Solirubrobacterales bacterium]
MPSRPSRRVIRLEWAAVAAAVVVAVAANGIADWDPALFATLAALSIISDLIAVQTRVQRVVVSASLTTIVVAAVFLGPGPAAAMSVVTILAGWARHRYPGTDLLINLVAYLWFALLAGLFFEGISQAGEVERGTAVFYLAIFGAFLIAMAVDFLLIGGYSSYIERSSFATKARRALMPVLPSELAAATLAVGVSLAYVEAGTEAVALFSVLILVFQYLVGALLQSQDRADELEVRTRQLAGFQVALLSALLRTLDLRDRMTARHSAAVARYSREIAARAGLSAEDQELVHTAALLHDIGKFILPDNILKGGRRKLTEAEWVEVRKHPQEGARIVSQIAGYQPIGEIILAHHERIDGKGYPRALRGEEIPALARVVSVADAYDVLTGRDTYREPVSSHEAVIELRRVAGTQLDPRFVEAFASVLEGKDLAYRRGDDVDFEAELALDKRIHDYVQDMPPAPDAARLAS